MRIEKFYSRNINLGNYESLRLGLTIKYDKEIKSAEELKQISKKLLKLAEKTIQDEIDEVKTKMVETEEEE